MLKQLKQWFDNSAFQGMSEDVVDWPRVIPYILLHLSCLLVFVVGVSWIAVVICLASYFIRMFAITAFYHRYFSHKSFKTSRLMQAVFGFLGATATQRGPLWWAAHHRHHHKHADTEEDAHSPKHGFLRSHTLWFLTKKNFPTREERVKDLLKFKELRWLDRFDVLPPVIYAALILGLGAIVESVYPELGATKWQILIWGYFISTVLLSHVTFLINSLAHRWGYRSYETEDDSRNNPLLALLTLGEGWHNNHHKFPALARQGLKWWEIDISYYILLSMEKLGLVWDLKKTNKKLSQES
ncbi:stearoyl-CoA desaturase [Kangiella sediminilitoris]|uniref:Stearoyl-CoA desaturase n=2 Tax=Kangiella sediminilitoris TaxID=1144748 RepID=A0A1B3B861_9GAMM|nr:acyl-CoA desaturase [Kangiella sediminilitoris]AOE48965.1 stearoyl-CoA desaturase [Kangiella sediminilitoris]